MKIFKAEPIESSINEHHWNASTHKGWAIIRAEDEDGARRIASSEFVLHAPLRLGEQIPVNPWRAGHASYTELTNAEIESSGYSIEGEEGIIKKEGDR